uniref:Ionotropic glutamate receptor C-terminal domain-containing protein n=1 Tax=Glossina brevipalpis TaxID=37001 RepID=A0A1A9W573_9MUSC
MPYDSLCFCYVIHNTAVYMYAKFKPTPPRFFDYRSNSSIEKNDLSNQSHRNLSSGQYSDFTSFLNANATLAVIVDQTYMQHQTNEFILNHFQKILNNAVHENLKYGGINFKYFTWTGIRLKKGKEKFEALKYISLPLITDTLAALTVMDCDNTWNFFEDMKTSNILVIALTNAECPRLPINQALMLLFVCLFMVKLRIPYVNHGQEFPQMILDAKMQRILNWQTAIVIMDQVLINENNHLTSSIMHESIKRNIEPISIVLYSIDDQLKRQKKRSAIRDILQLFSGRSQSKQQFMIFSKFYEDIIEIAENMQMFHVSNQWLFFIFEDTEKDFDVLSVTQNLEEGANIAFALNETRHECQISLNCTMSELSKALVNSISQLTLEEQSLYGAVSDEEWEYIRYTKEEQQNEILNYMRKYMKDHTSCSSCARWRIITALTWGKNQEHQKIIHRREISENRNKNFEFIDVGYWSPTLGVIAYESLFPHIVHHFRNITLDILTIHNPPWQIIKKDTKGTIIEYSGIVMEIVKELSRMLNFTYKLHDANTLEFEAYENQNETVITKINLYFMAAVAATINDPDKKAFNFTTPISIQRYSFLTRKPEEVSRIYLFTAPFTLETWVSLIAVIFITAPILYLVNCLVPTLHLKVQGFCTLRNCFWYIYGGLLQQGGMYLPKADSGRLIIGVWWIVVIVLVTTYCGNLVAFLTFPRFQPGFDYLHQLFVDQSFKELGLRNNTFFESYAAISSRLDFQKYLNHAIIYNNSVQENLEAVKSGDRINVDWRINLQLIIQNHFEKEKECTLSMSKESFLDEQIGLIIPVDSPYLDLINTQIYRLYQMGFIERWHQTNLPSMNKCNGKGLLRYITNHKVNLDDMQGCFLVLLTVKNGKNAKRSNIFLVYMR